jgi:mono/diheme cytochrome c family protein
MAAQTSEKWSKNRARRQKQARTRALRNGVLAILVLAGVLYAVLSLNRKAEPLATEQVIARGAEVYAANCASCHGDRGQGHALLAQAPALDGSEHAWHHPDGQIQALLLDGGILMPSFEDQLDNEEMYAVLRYIQTWWRADQLASQQAASQSQPFRE